MCIMFNDLFLFLIILLVGLIIFQKLWQPNDLVKRKWKKFQYLHRISLGVTYNCIGNIVYIMQYSY